jgi:hypothetical protein
MDTMHEGQFGTLLPKTIFNITEKSRHPASQRRFSEGRFITPLSRYCPKTSF